MTVLPIYERTMLERASRAVGKIDTHGRRGITICSADEIEAMALVLAALGLVPTLPGKPSPTAFIVRREVA